MYALILAGGTGERLRPGVHFDSPGESEPLCRGGAFRKVFELVPPDVPFVIGTNGDNVTDQPLAPLVRSHRRSGAVATVMLAPLVSPFGLPRLGGRSRTRS